MKAKLEFHEMPKNCLECVCAHFNNAGELRCSTKDENGVMLNWKAYTRKRRPDCPLKPVEDS